MQKVFDEKLLALVYFIKNNTAKIEKMFLIIAAILALFPMWQWYYEKDARDLDRKANILSALSSCSIILEYDYQAGDLLDIMSDNLTSDSLNIKSNEKTSEIEKFNDDLAKSTKLYFLYDKLNSINNFFAQKKICDSVENLVIPDHDVNHAINEYKQRINEWSLQMKDRN